ncbi:LysR family transcriptional regulator [Martelella sp. FOR1707]
MLHVSLRQFEYLVAIGKAGSLSTAASQLNVSQPALSVAISHVEARVGAALFLRRKGVAITPTPFGRIFLEEAEALIAEAERLEAPGALSRRQKQRVTLGVVDELAPTWLAPILRLTRTQFPQTEIRVLPVSFEAVAETLLSGGIDVALTYDLGLDASFQRDWLVDAAPWVWVSPEDPLAAKEAVSLLEIADRPLILSDQGLSIRHMLGLFRAIGATPMIRHRAASIELLRSLVANGEGTGLSYTNPAGLLSYDGKPLARVGISDRIAVEPLVLAYIGAQPAPLPKIRLEIQSLARNESPSARRPDL